MKISVVVTTSLSVTKSKSQPKPPNTRYDITDPRSIQALSGSQTSRNRASDTSTITQTGG